MVNILIFRTDRIGDLIYTGPVIFTIKRYFKESQITLITSEKNYKFAKDLNIFHEVIKFPRRNFIQIAIFFTKLLKKRFSYIFIFDGKERSILSSFLLRGKEKIALAPKIKFYYKLLNIHLIDDYEKKNLNESFQEMLNYCEINTKIDNYNFISRKKDNKFSSNIPIKNYIHIHLDEKWISDLYIKNYTDINPSYNSFVNLIEIINKKSDILITTGLNSFDLIDELKNSYFTKISEHIFFKNNLSKSIYFVFKPSFEDLESLLRNAKVLISCHGAITHASNSFDIKKIDILEEKKYSFYLKYTSYLKNYSSLNRTNFDILKKNIIKIL